MTRAAAFGDRPVSSRNLAREFRDLAGCPPSVWLAEEFRNVQALTSDDVPALLA